MKFLVPIDGSAAALDAVKYAASIAKNDADSKVTLAYIILSDPYFNDSPDTVAKAGQGKADEAIAEALKLCDGVATDTIVELSGNVPNKIVDMAEKGDFDTIVMGSIGMSGIKRFMMGSVSTKVSQHAPCTVTLVR